MSDALHSTCNVPDVPDDFDNIIQAYHKDSTVVLRLDSMDSLYIVRI